MTGLFISLIMRKINLYDRYTHRFPSSEVLSLPALDKTHFSNQKTADLVRTGLEGSLIWKLFLRLLDWEFYHCIFNTATGLQLRKQRARALITSLALAFVILICHSQFTWRKLEKEAKCVGVKSNKYLRYDR